VAHNQVLAVLKMWMFRAIGCEEKNDNDEHNDEEVEPGFWTKPPGYVASRRHDVDDERCPRALVLVKPEHTHDEQASDEDEGRPPAQRVKVIAETTASALAALGPSASMLYPVESSS